MAGKDGTQENQIEKTQSQSSSTSTEEAQSNAETQETDKNVDENDEAENSEEAENQEEEESQIDAETLALAKLLQNPTSREYVIKLLGKDAKEEVDKGKPAAEAVKSVGEMLKKHFGPGWEQLSEKLTPILDHIYGQLANLEAKLTTAEQKRVEQSTKSAADHFYEKHPEAKQFEARIVSLMEKYDPAEGVDAVEYLEDLYTIARSQNRGKAPTSKESLKKAVENKVKKNSTDVSLKSGGGTATQTAPKNMTIKEAIAAAQQQLSRQK